MKYAMTFLGLAILSLILFASGWVIATSNPVVHASGAGQVLASLASILTLVGGWGFGLFIILAIVFFVIKK